MKTRTLSVAEFIALRNPDRTFSAPEGFDRNRTAFKSSKDGFEYVFQEWPSRGAWSKVYAAQGRRAPKATDWVPVFPQD